MIRSDSKIDEDWEGKIKREGRDLEREKNKRGTCWKKRVIFPLKQNPNRATQQIILNK